MFDQLIKLLIISYLSLYSQRPHTAIRTQTREKACKGTTKNAHEQIFLEKNVFLDKICHIFTKSAAGS